MPSKYVIKFVSLVSNTGKTTIASRVVRNLKEKGYRIGVIKHCSKGITLEEKDSKRYLEAGADIVVASSPHLAVVYMSNFRDTMESALMIINTPVVVVEGYKGFSEGDSVVIARNADELRELIKQEKNIIAAVSLHDTRKEIDKIPLFKPGEEFKLTELIEKRMLEHYIQQTPRSNCTICGFQSCEELVKAYLRDWITWCPKVSKMRVVIDNMEVPLNSFVKNVIKSTIRGLLSALKGVPPNYKKILIEIDEL